MKNDEIYTVRLGMHSHPHGLGAFTKDSLAVCVVPTTISKRHRVIALFAKQEIYPALFMNFVDLNTEQPFRLELIRGSAALVRNNDVNRLLLGDDAVSFKEDQVIISSSELSNKTPNYLNYTYDFIMFQVRAATEEECILQKQVRRVDGADRKWRDSVTAQIGDVIEFRVQYTNGSGLHQKVAISEELPPCFGYVKSEAFLYSSEVPEGKPLDSGTFVASGIEIDRCGPEETVVIHYTVEVIDYPPEDQQGRQWNWTEVRAGSKVLENYAEVIIDTP